MVSKKHSKHGQTDYRYDRTGRIEGCRNQRYWETLQYDAAANLLDSKYREDYSNHNLIRCNQLLHFRGHHYRYDEHGRTQTKQTIGATQHYYYDADHRLSEVRIEQLNKTERYRYLNDALGRRIEKQKLDREGKPYNRTRFLWDGLRMIQETGPNHPTSLYIYTDQNSYEPLARIDTDGNQEQHIRYFHTDLNGCPEELTDANGKILWECSFQLWGKRIHEIEHESVEQNLRYQGQYLDRETGLHYNTFRYYDPDIGRFTQPDPIGLAGGFNLYQYAPNGLTWVDPWGWSCGSTKDSYQRAMNKALKWLEKRGFKAEKINTGKFGSIKGKPVGMTTADGKTGFRIEYDERSGAHINVFSGKEKGEHFLFDATESIVTKLQGLFNLPSKPRRDS
ncbi:RHS repeat-associated core domain-containing protein [Gilliamella apicola]|uniref:RHS repeat domain-containing protein n=1 Tax=Gilliamella sp. Nev3-1 TaxID=3120250 RepID=UPI001C400659|nr:RHS repeat-associated core domain-containing protein [Gilliamella apicola]